jgi:putative ABC transport system permease protein
MLRHDFAVALKRLMRERLHSALGIVVLSLGIACFLTAYVFISYVLSFDRNFANVDRTYLVAQGVGRGDQNYRFFFNSAYPLADDLRTQFPDLDAVARAAPRPLIVTVDGERSERFVSYAEAPFTDIFDFVVLAGSTRGALAEPRSAVLTEDTARSLFGTIDAVGKTFAIGDKEPVDLTVRAVVAELPRSSHLARGTMYAMGFEMLVSWDVFELLEKNQSYSSWGNSPVMTYVLLPASGAVSAAELDRRLALVAERNTPPEKFFTVRLKSRPITEFTPTALQGQFEGYSGNAWRIDVFQALLIFSGVILAIACMNFVNLATAQSMARTLEIGTRKAIGASATQIVRQELIHTALLVTISIVAALAAMIPLRFLISGAYAVALTIPWLAPRLWIALAGLAAGVTILAGLYPALALSGVRPMTALRGGSRLGPRRLRTVLVGVQFAAASVLAALLVIVYAQGSHARDAVLGKFSDQYVAVWPPVGVARDAWAAELARDPKVRGVALTSRAPWVAGGPLPLSFSRSSEETAPSARLDEYYVGYDYFEVMNAPILAGRSFSRDHADDPRPLYGQPVAEARNKPFAVVLDRAAALSLGWSAPSAAIGQIFYMSGKPAPQYEVVGVVENLPLNVRAPTSAGVAFGLSPPGTTGVTLVRFAPRDTAEVLAHLDATAKKLAPDHGPPFRRFFDELFEDAYSVFRIAERVLTGLALFALAISGVGLFGMASYVTMRRTREIGVRKTHGASSSQIVRLLLWDFSKPVVIANLVAWPIAWVLARRYLDLFNDRIALTAVPFLGALAWTVLLAWLTVGAQSRRAARLRPTDALRQQ